MVILPNAQQILTSNLLVTKENSRKRRRNAYSSQEWRENDAETLTYYEMLVIRLLENDIGKQ